MLAPRCGQPPSVVVGLHLLLNGLGRFVEEGCRGEPQGRRWAGLVEYQWYAIASVVAGAVVTCVPPTWPAVTEASPWTFVAFAMGVDFPASDRRFARLVK